MKNGHPKVPVPRDFFQPVYQRQTRTGGRTQR
jgi:hypothetical protein